MNRVSKLLNQIENDNNKNDIKIQNVGSYLNNNSSKDDIVIVSGIRTAIGRAKRGVFNSTPVTQLLAPVLKYVTKDLNNKSLVDDIRIGNVLAKGGLRASECRMAQFIAGIPDSTTISTCNRQCSSGLQAIADIASSINSGYINIGIAGGVESMTLDKMSITGYNITDDVKLNNDALNCLLPMGITSENVAKKFGVTRQEQDELAVLSNKRAINAKLKYRDEIIPIKTVYKDRKTGKKIKITVIDDDGPRPNTTIKVLGKLKAAFKKNGTTTAGNSSQVSDGAAAVLMMKRSKALELGYKPMGKLVGFAVSGVPPNIMGIGPAYAIPRVLKQCGLTIDDIDLFEINEAFASQAVYCVKKLGLSMDKVNVNGGAIAIGHPLGCTGTRMTITLLKEMERRGLKRGIVSMCIGSGMGAAAIFERD